MSRAFPSCVSELEKADDGRQVVVAGWLRRIRRADDGYRFDLYDRTGTVAGVRTSPGPSEDMPGAESAIRAVGRMCVSARGTRLFAVEDMDIVGAASGDELASSARYLDLRDHKKFKVFAIQSTVEASLREFALDNGFVELHTPKISGGGSESGATVFDLPYFGDTAYLVQSPQFYMQMAMVAGFDRVFEIGPVFRAEPGKSPLHASEFTIAHFEMSWIDSHWDLMDFEERLLRHAFAATADAHGPAIEENFGMPARFPTSPAPRFSIGTKADNAEGGEAAEEEALGFLERQLAKRAQHEHGHSLAFLEGYPAAVRPFYTMHEGVMTPGGATLSRSFDLLWHGIEITSGGQREHRFAQLEKQIADAGISPSICERYIEPHFLEMFRRGAPPHGGFGIGLNRLMMAMLGQSSIRDTSFVFRGPRSCMP